MDPRLIIIGAGGFGREVLNWARDVATKSSQWRVFGFLDNNRDALAGYHVDCEILGDPDSFQPQLSDLFVCAIANPVTRLNVCRKISEKGGQFTTLIHPLAILGSRCTIGPGSIVCPYTVLTTNVTLGSHVILNTHCCIGHDAILGDGCTLSPNGAVGGNAVLGVGVFMGMHSAVLQRVHVGDRAVIGAGSVAFRKVAAGTTVVGVPAKRILPGVK
jgi:sugar O-acyltransferase (sialic acid O-acetyltransferase NeuD family)